MFAGKLLLLGPVKSVGTWASKYFFRT